MLNPIRTKGGGQNPPPLHENADYSGIASLRDLGLPSIFKYRSCEELPNYDPPPNSCSYCHWKQFSVARCEISISKFVLQLTFSKKNGQKIAFLNSNFSALCGTFSTLHFPRYQRLLSILRIVNPKFSVSYTGREIA